MKLTEFTRPEVEYLRQECNFTDEERAVFDMRASARSIVEIGLALHMSESTVYRKLNCIKRKILRVL